MVEVTRYIDLFESIELSSRDGLEIASHLAVTWGTDSMMTVDLYHSLEIYVFKCNLTNVIVLEHGTLMIQQENRLDKKRK